LLLEGGMVGSDVEIWSTIVEVFFNFIGVLGIIIVVMPRRVETGAARLRVIYSEARK
jgi:hypothetical protein